MVDRKSGARRGRPGGPDPKKIMLIVKILYDNQEGLWLREIANRARLHPSTVSHYIETFLAPIVEDRKLGEEKPILRMIRLKPLVIEKISQGESLPNILRYLKLMEKFRSI